jgi:ATP-dependent Clp protease ATP-binding subunit ClpA
MNWLDAFLKKLTAPHGAAPGDSMPEFTPRAQQTLALARKEADRFHHNFVGTEHLLLGLLKLGQGGAVNVLLKLGLSLEKVRAEVEKQIGTGPDLERIGNLPYTPRVRKVLALAAREAKELNHTYVGTEHILLGLLRERDSVAARVLRNCGIDTEQTRQEILEELDPLGVAAAARAGISKPVPSEPAVDRSELPRDRFTPRVRRTFTLALEVAEWRNQAVVETEHVLLGLVLMGQGVAASVLIRIGVNAETIAAHFDPPSPAKPASANAEAPQFGALVKEVLTLAEEEARALEHAYIGTEHILLGLLRQPHGGAGRIFKELYVDPEALRKQVMLAFEVKNVEPKAGEAGDKILEQFGSRHTETFAKKTSAAPNPSPVPTLPNMPSEPVDLTQRYDVYCVERNEILVVHRNVRFRSARSLIPQSDSDPTSDFVELEQPDGQTFFIAKSAIIRFCAPGAKLDIENL